MNNPVGEALRWKQKYFDLMEQEMELKEQYAKQQAIIEAYQKRFNELQGLEDLRNKAVQQLQKDVV